MSLASGSKDVTIWSKERNVRFPSVKIRHHWSTGSKNSHQDHTSNQGTKSTTKQWLKNHGMLKTITHKTNLCPFPEVLKELLNFHDIILLYNIIFTQQIKSSWPIESNHLKWWCGRVILSVKIYWDQHQKSIPGSVLGTGSTEAKKKKTDQIPTLMELTF